VKEVMLRDIQLPAGMGGLQALLLKDRRTNQMSVETELKTKEVRIAELEAEAMKGAAGEAAEGEARVRVLRAKSESDAMQYTLHEAEAD